MSSPVWSTPPTGADSSPSRTTKSPPARPSINPVRYKVTAFVFGAFFAGIAGGLYAHHKSFLSPTGFGFMKSIDIVVMVILGGMGRTFGVIIAAVLLTLLPEFLRGFEEYRMIIYSGC